MLRPATNHFGKKINVEALAFACTKSVAYERRDINVTGEIMTRK
jgi:hypothetical protein